MFLYRLINTIFNVMQYAILAEVILSWVYIGRSNQYIEILHRFTEPLLTPGRKIQQRYFNNMMIDFSPIIALLMISVIRGIIIRILF